MLKIVIFTAVIAAVTSTAAGAQNSTAPVITEQAMGNYTARWRWIRSAKGLKSAIDLNSISKINMPAGSADAVIFIDQGSQNWMADSHRVRFDCRGNFIDIDSSSMIALPIKEGGVIAEMSLIACSLQR